MTKQRSHFAKGCFIFLALGTTPIMFMNFTGYIAGLGFIAFISVALAYILF
jgi:hypothetical protein